MKVVVCTGDADEELHIGVVTHVNSDNTFEVQYAGGDVKHAIVRSNIMIAPPVEEVLCMGARVGVQFPGEESPFMGIITCLNADGTVYHQTLC